MPCAGASQADSKGGSFAKVTEALVREGFEAMGRVASVDDIMDEIRRIEKKRRR